MWPARFRYLCFALATTLPAQSPSRQPGQLPDSAQSPPAASGAQTPANASADAGLASAWDVGERMKQLVAVVRKFEPILKQLKPNDWIAKGASGAYIKQTQSSLASMQSLSDAAERLARDPERLTTALDAYFLMERMELFLNSLREGVRRYQSAETANQLNVVLGEASVHREKLREHIQELANTREQEFKLVDQEAQRCRGMLSRQAPEAPKPEHRRNTRQ